MSKEQKHTETPWQVDEAWNEDTDTKGVYISSLRSNDFRPTICDMYYKPIDGALHQFSNAKANADFIVKAVNCHYDMLEALKMFAKGFDGKTFGDGTAMIFAKAAIEKATREEA